MTALLLISTGYAAAQTTQNAPRRAENFSLRTRTFFPLRKKPTKEQKKLLEPRSEDLFAHARLLEQENTGIFRLLPDLGCEDNSLIIKADETCLNAVPESSFYSFREKEYVPEILADIRLKNNHLISNGILSQGIIVPLGDVALENVGVNSDGMKFLNDYVPQTINKEAQKQHLQMAHGVKSGKYIYRKIAPAMENMTYALRTIAYKGSIYRSFRGFRFNLLEGDKRIDLTLAFRIIRREEDGALTVIWKELERREAPRIKFQKRKKSVDKSAY